MADDNPSYDPYERRRIWLALNEFRARRNLTWKQLAAQIETHTGIVFHQRYFGRLRKGALGNPLVHTVVKAMDKLHPGFSASLGASFMEVTSEFEAASIETFTGSEFLNWKKLEERELEQFASSITLPKHLAIRRDECEAHSGNLSFAPDVTLYRICLHSSLPTLYIFIASDGLKAVSIGECDWEQFRELFPLDVSPGNVAECGLFYISFFADDGEKVQLLPTAALIEDLKKTNRLIFEGDKARLWQYPPRITVKRNEYAVDFLAVIDDALVRMTTAFNASGDVLSHTYKRVGRTEAVQAEKVQKDQFPGLKISPHKHGKQILRDARAAIAKSATGRLVSRSCDLYEVEFLVVPLRNFHATYLPDTRTVIIAAPFDTETLKENEIFQLVVAMRYADQEAIGMAVPPPKDDIMHYATVLHAKTLDAYVWACKFIRDMDDENDRVIYQRHLRPSLLRLYEGVCKDVRGEELFRLYAQLR